MKTWHLCSSYNYFHVFMKLFDENGTNRSRWGEEDMNKYQAYICDELKDYLNIKK